MTHARIVITRLRPEIALIVWRCLSRAPDPRTARWAMPPVSISIRLVAIALVTIQHTLSLTDHDAWATWGPINVGQLGVSLFLGVSGHLSMTGCATPVAGLQGR